MAREMGVSIRTIWRIKSGEVRTVNSRTWESFSDMLKSGKRLKTTSEANTDRDNVSRERLKVNPISNRKLTPRNVRAIRKLYKQPSEGEDGESKTETKEGLARTYGVSIHTISKVVYGNSWKSV